MGTANDPKIDGFIIHESFLTLSTEGYGERHQNIEFIINASFLDLSTNGYG